MPTIGQVSHARACCSLCFVQAWVEPVVRSASSTSGPRVVNGDASLLYDQCSDARDPFGFTVAAIPKEVGGSKQDVQRFFMSPL